VSPSAPALDAEGGATVVNIFSIHAALVLRAAPFLRVIRFYAMPAPRFAMYPNQMFKKTIGSR
jgi:hypothetical protein